MEWEEHTIIPEGDVEVVFEIAEVVPLGHLVLGKRTSYSAVRVLVVPPAVTLAIGLS